jgi:hypothetical protein
VSQPKTYREHLEASNVAEIPEMAGVLDRLGVFERAELDSYLQELAKRDIEALNLYEPLPFQEQFHACKARYAAIVAGNQVGKSLAAFVEDARAVTGQDPHNKYPKKDGLLICVCEDQAHIGHTVFRYLFEPNAFQMIRDETTGEWRSYKPWLPGDAIRFKEVRPSPPLIPPRLIDGKISFENKGMNIFAKVRLKTGWTILARGSKGDPIQGVPANLVHIDEDLARQDWFQELVGRITMSEGRTGSFGKLRWSALPHATNNALINLLEDADAQKGDKVPEVEVFYGTVFDNPFMDEGTRQSNIARWKKEGEDVYRMRALGQVTSDTVLMYPAFSKYTHAAGSEDKAAHPIHKILRESNGLIPDGWTRYAWVDPGISPCAVLFLAVPPPSLGDFVVAYDELYMNNCTPDMFGNGMREKCGDLVFQLFGIDEHMSRQRSIGSNSGKTVKQQYADALRKRGIQSEATGHSFRSGSDDTHGRQSLVRTWLSVRREGTPKFLYVPSRCVKLAWEFSRYKKKTVNKMVIDEANTRTPNHLMNCLEYAAAHGSPYVPPPKRASEEDEILARFLEEEARIDALAARGGDNIFRPQSNTIVLGPLG